MVNAGVRPGSRATFVPAKVAKIIDAQSGLIRLGERKLGWVDQLATLQQGPPIYVSVHPKGLTAVVGHVEGEKELEIISFGRMGRRRDCVRY